MRCSSTVPAIGILLLSSAASATPRPLPFTYPVDTLPKGELEVEMYTDVNPLRVPSDAFDPAAGQTWGPSYLLQTELEYGLTSRWELAFYQAFEAAAQPGGDNAFQFDGLKWRARTRLADPGDWPVDVGLYFELETMHDEISLEAKVNLQRRIGRYVRAMVNLWVEEAFVHPFDGDPAARDTEFIINPTAGLVFQVSPGFQPGIEYWARGQIAPGGLESIPDYADDFVPQPERAAMARANDGVNHFLGPTVHLNFGRLWWSAGLYFHLNGLEARVGDAYGPVWFRSVLGLEL